MTITFVRNILIVIAMLFAFPWTKTYFTRDMIMGKSNLALSCLGELVMAVKWPFIRKWSISLQGGTVMRISSGRDNLRNLVEVKVCKRAGNLGQGGILWLQNGVGRALIMLLSILLTYAWSIKMGRMMRIMREQSAAIVSSSWSGMGNSMTSAHDDGTICL